MTNFAGENLSYIIIFIKPSANSLNMKKGITFTVLFIGLLVLIFLAYVAEKQKPIWFTNDASGSAVRAPQTYIDNQLRDFLLNDSSSTGYHSLLKVTARKNTVTEICLLKSAIKGGRILNSSMFEKENIAGIVLVASPNELFQCRDMPGGAIYKEICSGCDLGKYEKKEIKDSARAGKCEIFDCTGSLKESGITDVANIVVVTNHDDSISKFQAQYRFIKDLPITLRRMPLTRITGLPDILDSALVRDSIARQIALSDSLYKHMLEKRIQHLHNGLNALFDRMERDKMSNDKAVLLPALGTGFGGLGKKDFYGELINIITERCNDSGGFLPKRIILFIYSGETPVKMEETYHALKDNIYEFYNKFDRRQYENSETKTFLYRLIGIFIAVIMFAFWFSSGDKKFDDARQKILENHFLLACIGLVATSAGIIAPVYAILKLFAPLFAFVKENIWAEIAAGGICVFISYLMFVSKLLKSKLED